MHSVMTLLFPEPVHIDIFMTGLSCSHVSSAFPWQSRILGFDDLMCES